jgi:phosphoenolpyruvate carboxykinase (ATP)
MPLANLSSVILDTLCGRDEEGRLFGLAILYAKGWHITIALVLQRGHRPGYVSICSGLSGTGKSTLSADPGHKPIGDDEHCWSERGIFNMEDGCYAKCISFCHESEPEIFDAIRFGSVLENAQFVEISRQVDYADKSIPENRRCAYPIDYIPTQRYHERREIQRAL